MEKKKGNKVSGNVKSPQAIIKNIPNKSKNVYGMLNLIVGGLNPYFTLIASTLVIISFVFILPTYFTSYIISSETYKEFSPEDYLIGASLNTPNYTLKTTEIVVVQPTALWFNLLNHQTFYLPENSFNIKIEPSENYDYEIGNNNEKIDFYFHDSRSSIENIQIIYSYKQKKNPKIILLDYSGIAKSNKIEEHFILENTENAKITSYRVNWIVNEDEEAWQVNNIQHNPDVIAIDGTNITPIPNKTTLNRKKVLIYSWDMNFEENEIKSVKIWTNTNFNYSNFVLRSEYLRVEPAFEIEFPFKEDNFKWFLTVSHFENCSETNNVGYINGTCILMFPFPFNATVVDKVINDPFNEGIVLSYLSRKDIYNVT